MEPNVVFNITVCILGIVILLIHIANLLLKKERRRDENSLLLFFAFTMMHFATYLSFALLRTFNDVARSSDAFIISFYTVFYVMNNLEVFLFINYFCRYTNLDKKTQKIVDIINLSLLAIFIISDIVNIFTHTYFHSENGVYTRGKLMIISQGYQFVMLVVAFLTTHLSKNLLVREKIAFSLYCVLPFAAIIVQNFLPGYAIAYLVLLVAIEILFLFLSVEKNIKIKEDEKQIKEANIKIMMSQIQPHFVYNTLSSISTLISIDPNKAQKALDDFTDYLRMNFSTLTQTKLVSFEDELKHIKTYVNLEKMRFNNRLNVSFDIQVSDFLIPPLCIQPLVENAIKHGILKKVEGGSVILKTYEDKDAYYVEVIDDGVGFNMDEIDFKGNKHIGLNNVKHRISTMTKGDIIFTSEPNKGTKVLVKFYK